VPYNIIMSPAQLARCNRALPPEHQLTLTEIVHRPPLAKATIERVVRLDAGGLRRTLDALRANPEPHGGDPDLIYLEGCFEDTLVEPEDDGMLHGFSI